MSVWLDGTHTNVHVHVVHMPLESHARVIVHVYSQLYEILKIIL